MRKHRSTAATLHSSLIDAVIEGGAMGTLVGVLLLVVQPELRQLMVEQAGVVGIGSYLFVCAQCGAVLSLIGLAVLGIPAFQIINKSEPPDPKPPGAGA